MATTTNYGWTTPDDTDLVKDGAAAIRTLGSSIDTSFIADEGDLLLGGTSDIFEPLAIGAAATVLTSDGTTASWVAPAGGGGYTSIASGSLSGSSVAISSIPATYRDLVYIFRDYYFVNDDLLTGTLNGTNSIYTNQVVGNGDAPMTSGYVVPTQSENTDNSDQNNFMMLRFYDYANTTSHKIVDSWVIQRNAANNNYRLLKTITGIRLTSAINAIVFGTQTGGNISGGTYELFGVK
jgi:hypothetical protein